MFISVFVIFFSIGHVLGWTLDGQFSDSNDNSSNLSKQLNILIITIDNFDAEEPKLDGIWLALFLPINSTASFIPIIPTRSVENLIFEQIVIDNFYLKTNKTLGSAFVNILNQNKIYWDNIIIIDSIGWSELVTSIASYNIASGFEKIDLINSNITKPNNILNSTNIQAQVIQHICLNQPFSNGHEIFETLLHSKHIFTDLKNNILDNFINGDSHYSYGLVCKFPTLEIEILQ